MNYTRPFNTLSKNDAHIAGGKGASLGEMLQNNIPVPDGYVITADTFDYFIKETDLIQEIDAILDTVDTQAIHTVEHASEKIQTLIKHATMPQDIADEILEQYRAYNMEYVAVRSSATAEDGADHAWAGQLSSYLNTTDENLLEMVQNCWASLFTPRAIFYRFEKGLDATHISVAVVIQKMINSEKSGIAFSVHPVTEDYNQIIIEAGLGLGEAIVSGSVTPDSYVITKQPQNIIDINVNTQNKALYRSATLDTDHGFNEWRDLPTDQAETQVLNKNQITELSDIIVNIENHYGFPCDIEWAFENDTFYIVQSRPITTLKHVSNNKKLDFEKVYTRDTSRIIQQAWVADISHPSFVSQKNEHLPSIIHYMHEGVIEVWENHKTSQWFMDTLQDCINNNEEKFSELIEQYKKIAQEIISLDKKNTITTAEELKLFIDKVFRGMQGFNAMYFSSMDDRTPQSIKDISLALRDTDVFFDTSDKIIRQALKRLYPDLVGLESAIVKSEISDPPSREILSERKNNFAIIEDYYAEIITRDDFLNSHPQFNFKLEIPPSDHSTLKGQVGNKGYQKGVVRIMKRKEQIPDAQEGDIIVSTMTTPDFIPAMKKAGAIITDEGGITCHAAIVARELNKPCVIGTKFATQILKDGDLVEVDADNGIVKILEKNDSSSKILKKYLDHKSEEDVLVVRGRFSPLFVTTWILGSGEIALYYGFKGDKALASGRLDLYQGFAFNTFENYLSDKFNLEEFKKKYSLYKKTISDLYDSHINCDLTTYLENELTESLRSVQDIYDNMITDTLFIQFLEASTVKAVLDKLSKKVGSIDTILEHIASTPFNSFVKRFENTKISLAQSGISKGTINQAKYLYTDYYSTKERDLIEQDLTTYINKEIEEIAYKDEKFVSKLNQEELNVYEYIKYVTHLRDYRKDDIAKCQALLQVFSEELIHRAGLNKQDALYVLPTELTQGINWIKEHKGLIQDRIHGFEAFTHGRDIIEVSNNENINLDAIEKQLASHDDSDSIFGEGASKGIARGIVRIILDAQSKDNVFNEGDILVTSMTRPEFVPLMKKAEAIVTNEGGITCHAAIVSRELNKPCVIGTKFATQILKDGDLVEVDADNGIVKILEKNESHSLHLFYESYGYSFLLEDLIAEYYLQWDTVVYAKASHVKKYVTHQTLNKLKQQGLSITEQNIHASVDTINSHIESLKKQQISQESLGGMFDSITSILESYVVFDSSYSEGVYEVNDKDTRLAIIEQQKNNLREKFDWVFFGNNSLIQKIINFISKTKEISKDDLHWYRFQEIKDFLSSDKILSNLEIKKRKTAYLFQRLDNTIKFFSGDEALDELENIKISNQNREENILSGVVAHKSNKIIKGEVFTLMRDHSDNKTFSKKMDDMPEGAVLVTTMTDPEFIPVMKKASAILTQISGQLSHAAISARELNIPCVVGIDGLKEILKDGDLVEVDADNGVVNILNKKSA